MGNAQVFNDVIALLGDRFGYLIVDLPGHGQTKVTGKDDLYNMQNTAQALIELLDKLAIKKCFLLGYSMGGRLALYLALHFPQYFSKVVLESASPGLKTQAQRTQRIAQDLKIAQQLEVTDFQLFLTKWYCNPLFASLKQHPQFPKLLAKRLQNNPLELARSLRNLSTGLQPSLWKKLPDNKVPMLLLAGELDHKFMEINTEMADLCDRIQLTIVAGCGHNIHFENPAQFASIVRDFLLDM